MAETPLFIVEELALPGVFKITPKQWSDERGYFVNTYIEDEFAKLGILAHFVQDNMSQSRKNVIRGMHFQGAPFAQAKLVRCTQGKILDVAADYNRSSPSFSRHVSVELDSDTQTMLYIPEEYAHGFCVLSEEALVEYKVTKPYHPEVAGGVPYNDPLFNIAWPVSDPILSLQDKSWKPLS